MTFSASVHRFVAVAFFIACASSPIFGRAASAQSIVGIPFASPAPSPSGAPGASAPVELDGRTLFSVTAGDAGAHLDATTRADDVEAVLAEIIATVDSGANARTNYDPTTLRVVVAESGGETVVQAVDARHTTPLEIVTATLPDAQANDVAPKILAMLQKDDAWGDAILDPAEWIGVESMSRDGVVIRARIKTAPLRQFALQRELNYRVVRAFADAKIALGAPIPAMS